MQAVIKIDDFKSYNLDLDSRERFMDSKVYKLALKLFSVIKESFSRLFSYIDDFMGQLDFQVFGLIGLDRKIKSSAIHHFNHTHTNASRFQKQALETYIFDKLGEQFPELNQEHKKTISKKIANDEKIFYFDGLCLGYSWLFSAFMLSNSKKPFSATELKNRFSQDQMTHFASAISFSNYVDLDEMVKKDNHGLTIRSIDLISSFGSSKKEEEAQKMLKKYVFQDFKLQNVTVASAVKLKIEDYRSYTKKALARTPSSLNEADHVRAQIREKFEEVMSASKKLEKELGLSEEIKTLYKSYDGKPLVFSVQTDDPGVSHAMCVYSSAATNQHVFFDSNLGILTFSTLDELSAWVEAYTKKTYHSSKANYFDAISI